MPDISYTSNRAFSIWLGSANFAERIGVGVTEIQPMAESYTGDFD
jgi:hypothetical protein